MQWNGNRGERPMSLYETKRNFIIHMKCYLTNFNSHFAEFPLNITGPQDRRYNLLEENLGSDHKFDFHLIQS